MKKFFSFILLATISVGAFADAFYCDPNTTNESGGLDWDDAISPTTLRTEITLLEDGDTVFFKGGTICVKQLSELWQITRSLTFIGGFDTAATGTVTQLPTYPSPTPTIITGDANNDGIPNKGDAQALMRVDFTGDYSRVFHLTGFDLINTFYDGEVDSPNDVLTSTAMCAAFRILCGTAIISHCHFYNHITPNGRGSQCVTSVGAKLHMKDCELHDCACLSRGSLLRSRQYFPSGKDTIGAINPDCVLERCCLYNGNNMAGEVVNTGGFYGGAAQISYGPFFAINTTIANSNGYSDGGGINTNKSGASFISCTIANNHCARADKEDEPVDSRNSYGSNFHIDKDGVVRIANSIVLGPNDNGSKQYAVLYSSDNLNSINTNCISGGYNITGTFFYYKNGVEENNQTLWLTTDHYTTPKGATVQHMADYLGTNPQMVDEGNFSRVMKPIQMQNGDNLAHLQELADAWCPKWTHVNAYVDQRGYNRNANVTGVGAFAHEATQPTAIKETSLSSVLNPQSYNLLGQPVGDDYKGIVIQKGKKYLVK